MIIPFILYGCQDEADGFGPKETRKTAITFSTYMPGMTRTTANVATLASLSESGGGFHLKAEYTDNDAIETLIDEPYYANETGQCHNATGTQPFWPNDKTAEVSFIGIYPTAKLGERISLAKNSQQQPELTYTTEGVDDYMVAYVTMNETASAEGSVNLSFKHLLAQVVLNVACDDATKKFTLQSAVLTAPASATYNCTEKAMTADTEIKNYSFVSGVDIDINGTAAGIGSLMIPASGGGISDGSSCQLTLNYQMNINGLVQSYEKSATIAATAGYVTNITATISGGSPLNIVSV